MKLVNKYTIALFFICLLVFKLNAQQRMQYTNQVLQGFMQNPALVGVENFSDVRLVYNKQWSGFDGAPSAKGIGFSSQLGNDTNNSIALKTLPLRGRTNPIQSKNTSTKSKYGTTKLGYGAVLFSEGDGTININEIQIMGSMQIPVRTNKLALGVGLGVTQHQFNPENLKLINSYDLTFSKQQLNIIKPTIQLGAMYYTNEFFIGFNTKQVVRSKFSYDFLSPDKRSELIAHSTLNAGLRLRSGTDYTFTPSVIFRRVKGAPSTADINIIADYKDLIKLGFMYRTSGDLAGIIGLIISHKYSVQYSYDITNSNMRTLYGNTHNLVLSIRFAKNEFGNTKPNNYW